MTEQSIPGGRYIHKPRRDQHVCDLPAEWIAGALWRCTEGHLWTVQPQPTPARGYSARALEWRPADLWTLITVRARGQDVKFARIDMANKNRVQALPKPSPPRTEQGPVAT
jgi:hypothetical protein